jgi:hypothetical protein
MDWKETLSKITSAAPMVGSLFGAPGLAVGSIVKLVASVLGVAPDQDAIAAEVQANPEAILKLKELENSHQIELQKLVIEAERVRLADVADARGREKAVTEKTGKADMNLYILSWVMVGGFFSLVGLLIFRPLPPDSSGVVMMLFGSLSAAFGAGIQYFFGSSAGSAAKTDMMKAK